MTHANFRVQFPLFEYNVEFITKFSCSNVSLVMEQDIVKEVKIHLLQIL